VELVQTDRRDPPLPSFFLSFLLTCLLTYLLTYLLTCANLVCLPWPTQTCAETEEQRRRRAKKKKSRARGDLDARGDDRLAERENVVNCPKYRSMNRSISQSMDRVRKEGRKEGLGRSREVKRMSGLLFRIREGEDQSVSQSVNRSINQSINQSMSKRLPLRPSLSSNDSE